MRSTQDIIVTRLAQHLHDRNKTPGSSCWFARMVKDVAAAQGKFQMMHFLDGRLPTMPPVVEEWRLTFLRAMSVVCDYPKAALRAMVVVSQHSEILLRATLALTNTLAFYLSALLTLNAALRRTLAGVVSSHGQLDRHPSICSTWPLCCGGGGRVRWWRSLVRDVPELCRCWLSVCVAVLVLLCVTFSTLLTVVSDLGPSVSTVLTFCGCIRTLLSTLQTVTACFTNVIGIVWDASSLMSSS